MQVDEKPHISIHILSFFFTLFFLVCVMCNKRNLKKLALKLSATPVENKNQKSLSDNMSNSYGDTKLNNNMQHNHVTNNCYYKQGPACILPNLYLGAYYNAVNKERLQQFGINCIINVASEVTNTSEPIEGIHYHHIQWTHFQNNLARFEFDKAIKLILAAHEKNQIVFIHCQQGIERSAALVLAFLLYTTRGKQSWSNTEQKEAWSLDRAFNYVREKAPHIRPNMELLYQLREYEQSFDHRTEEEEGRPIKKPTLQTRTRRSESCSSPTRVITLKSATSVKTQQQRRPRSQSGSLLSFNYYTPSAIMLDKHVLNISSPLSDFISSTT